MGVVTTRVGTPISLIYPISLTFFVPHLQIGWWLQRSLREFFPRVRSASNETLSRRKSLAVLYSGASVDSTIRYSQDWVLRTVIAIHFFSQNLHHTNQHFTNHTCFQKKPETRLSSWAENFQTNHSLGNFKSEKIEQAIQSFNFALPHYK